MLVRLTNGNTLDDKYNSDILGMSIVANGILVSTKNAKTEGVQADSTKTFYPWHQIEFVMGQRYEEDEEHELAQFYYIGVGA